MSSSLSNRPVRKPSRAIGAAVAAGALAFSLAACSDDNADIEQTADATETTEPAEDLVAPADPERPFASAELVNQDGENSGLVTFFDKDGKVEVHVSATDLAPGFHGMHIHETGSCEGDFSSAGGHLGGSDDHDHGGGQAGDMPSILINDDGSGEIRFLSDKLSEELLLDDDNSAVIVHEDPDNFAHIPERYAPDGPDEDTLSTGDAGDRELCGVVSEN